MGQKKIDLVSLALPRLTTQLCIQSFLRSWADRDRFHVRWIFHLDQYAGMEHNYLENLQMAAGLAGEFDESLLLTTKHNLGYGGSYARAFGLVEHDVLNVEDDFLWLRPNSWRLADVIRATGSRDGFSFQHQNVRFGGTTPAFWR
ncbi:hypothetical protein HQ590_14930, partial [bacterium]|nr:hypothetical protein [bacterium]